jgi:hypothetical protein
MGELDKEVFFVLHEEVVKKAHALCGGLNRKFDYTFYGDGSGANESKSIAVTVRDYLINEGYLFEHFTMDKKDNHIFNGSALRKAKGRYNKVGDNEKVKLEEIYIDAFLYFLGKSIADLETLAKEYQIENEINHTKSKKPKRRIIIEKTQMKENPDKKLDLLKKHFHDDFYLYSYNQETKNIYLAVLEIRLSGIKIDVKLKNSTPHDYFGFLDYNFINNDIIIITLESVAKNKGIFILLYVDLNNRDKALFYQGQMMRFGKGTLPVSSDTFIERITIGTGKPKIYKKDAQELPEHVRNFFDPPVFNKTDKKQFIDLESFMKWLKKKKNP